MALQTAQVIPVPLYPYGNQAGSSNLIGSQRSTTLNSRTLLSIFRLNGAAHGHQIIAILLRLGDTECKYNSDWSRNRPQPCSPSHQFSLWSQPYKHQSYFSIFDVVITFARPSKNGISWQKRWLQVFVWFAQRSLETILSLTTSYSFFVNPNHRPALSQCQKLTSIIIKSAPSLGPTAWSPAPVDFITDIFLDDLTLPMDHPDRLAPTLEFFDCQTEGKLSNAGVLRFIKAKHSWPDIATLKQISIRFTRPKELDFALDEEVLQYIADGISVDVRYPAGLDPKVPFTFIPDAGVPLSDNQLGWSTYSPNWEIGQMQWCIDIVSQTLANRGSLTCRRRRDSAETNPSTPFHIILYTYLYCWIRDTLILIYWYFQASPVIVDIREISVNFGRG